MTKQESDIANIGPHFEPDVVEIRADLEVIEKDLAIYEDKAFVRRMEAIDFIGFHMIGRVDALLQEKTHHAQLSLLKKRAEKLKAGLEALNTGLFKRLQTDIRVGKYNHQEFKKLINEYFGDSLNDAGQENPCYDNLDLFVNGLLPLQMIPEQTRELEPEMVYYQKTPARLVLELVEQVNFTEDDVFYDLGSGLGQVAILVNLLAGIKTIGIEFEPAFCNYSQECASALNLPDVNFINTDARKADYDNGTVFFMFTPFKGKIMQDVLELLRIQSLQRKIKIVTYGACTEQITLQKWLGATQPINDDPYKLNIFTSL